MLSEEVWLLHDESLLVSLSSKNETSLKLVQIYSCRRSPDFGGVCEGRILG